VPWGACSLAGARGYRQISTADSRKGADLLGRELASGWRSKAGERCVAVAPAAHDGAEPAGAELLVRSLNETSL
jgi:hypothetical protein